ncbi:Nramp family divalent metal transporter [Anatilimnocola floriformis]|uniref:Nramp family divalent metal transporter n=1 Tax=Anatilimnocola floriformis TaxID=2948575 RepID=UPI0020C3ECA6|nr:Nramp family divalent metal transporter [Anatilimnocola floriformis]
MNNPSEVVPSDVIPPGALPPLRWRDMPPPVPMLQMIGPSVILAGLALGSGEYILWPFITFKSQFVFFWACLIAVITQYFLNLEIMRWTLATGETTLIGFQRLSRSIAPFLLALNIIPWMLPAWAQGCSQVLGWLIFGPNRDGNGAIIAGHYDNWISIATLLMCGFVLTAGPVIYETVEKVQLALVALILIIVVALAVWLAVLRPDAVITQWTAVFTLGYPQFLPKFDESLTPMALLGALAFAGAGGTMNLAQANYIKDKGYGMGVHIGRLTNPFTGNEEAVSETGYHFPHTAENMSRWQRWWRAACWEHFTSFLLTCIVCLALLTLISYIVFYDAAGNLQVDPRLHKEGLGFVYAEAERLAQMIGPFSFYAFLIMGVAILFTTEFGVLDACSRISTDLVKVAWLRDNPNWSEGRLYFWFLWGEIFLAISILLLEWAGLKIEPLVKFQVTAALNGVVMLLYAILLFYMNRQRLPADIRIPVWRMAILGWTIIFFGFFSIWAAYDIVLKLTS